MEMATIQMSEQRENTVWPWGEGGVNNYAPLLDIGRSLCVTRGLFAARFTSPSKLGVRGVCVCACVRVWPS